MFALAEAAPSRRRSRQAAQREVRQGSIIIGEFAFPSSIARAQQAGRGAGGEVVEGYICTLQLRDGEDTHGTL